MFTGMTARSPSRAVNLSRARQRTGLLATATSAEAGKLIVFVPHSGPLGWWRSGLDARISNPLGAGAGHHDPQPGRDGDGQRPAERLRSFHQDHETCPLARGHRYPDFPAGRRGSPQVLRPVLRYHQMAVGHDLAAGWARTGGEPDGHGIRGRGQRPHDAGPGQGLGRGALAQPSRDQASHASAPPPSATRSSRRSSRDDGQRGRRGVGPRPGAERGSCRGSQDRRSSKSPPLSAHHQVPRTIGEARAFPLMTTQIHTFRRPDPPAAPGSPRFRNRA